MSSTLQQRSTSERSSSSGAADLAPHSSESSVERIKSLNADDTTGAPISRVPTSANDDALSRVLSANTSFSRSLPNMGADKPYPPQLPDRTPYRVEFDGPDDPLCPQNWSKAKKMTITVALAFSTANVAFGSAIYGAMSQPVEQKFHVGVSVSQLGVSLYVLGFAAGPCVWGPLSENFGRKIPLVMSSFLLVCFCFAAATAKDFQTLILSRFFAGVTGSAPFSVVPSVFVDIYDGHTRGKAASVFALCVSGGPMLAPVVGGYIVNSYLGWRWCLYISGIISALSLVLTTFLYQESYHPIILKNKAIELRERTKIWGIYAQHETISLSMSQIATDTVRRPLKMLFREPILFLMSMYGGFVYGLLYMSLSAIPLVYVGYGFKGGNIELPYISMFIGCVLCTFSSIYVFEPMYQKKLSKTNLPVIPEQRLVQMMAAGPIFAISIFWMFWTGAYPKTPEHPHGVHFMVPIIAGAFFGYGFLSIFMSMILYILDSYLMLAASAMAANTFLRSALGAAFPLFATQMFRNLGIQWAGTLIGCLSIILIPIPFLFYKFGRKLRHKSKYAMDLSQLVKEGPGDKVEDEL